MEREPGGGSEKELDAGASTVSEVAHGGFVKAVVAKTAPMRGRVEMS